MTGCDGEVVTVDTRVRDVGWVSLHTMRRIAGRASACVGWLPGTGRGVRAVGCDGVPSHLVPQKFEAQEKAAQREPVCPARTQERPCPARTRERVCPVPTREGSDLRGAENAAALRAPKNADALRAPRTPLPCARPRTPAPHLAPEAPLVVVENAGAVLAHERTLPLACKSVGVLGTSARCLGRRLRSARCARPSAPGRLCTRSRNERCTMVALRAHAVHCVRAAVHRVPRTCRARSSRPCVPRHTPRPANLLVRAALRSTRAACRAPSVVRRVTP